MNEPTELDKRRSVYVDQIIDHVHNAAAYPDSDVRFLVDNLLMEWGADAYIQGQTHAAETIQRYASTFMSEKHKLK